MNAAEIGYYNKILNVPYDLINYVLGFKNALSFVFILVLHQKAVHKWTDSTCEVVLYIFLATTKKRYSDQYNDTAIQEPWTGTCNRA
jgi:hypothetical protein